jgi:hypothetical protein
VRQPINPDGSSVFSRKRGVIPVKFRLTQSGQPTCALLPATINVIKAAAETLASVDESVYSSNADSGSNLRVDQGSCQYIYHLSASHLGVGTYRIDIGINGISVGHAVFALK